MSLPGRCAQYLSVPDIKNPFLVVLSRSGSGKPRRPYRIPAFWREHTVDTTFAGRISTWPCEGWGLGQPNFDFKTLALHEWQIFKRNESLASVGRSVQETSLSERGKPGIRAQLVDIITQTQKDFVWRRPAFDHG